MKPNKSIDGLITRDAKNSASKVLKASTKKPTLKPVKNLDQKPVEHKKSTSLEEAILENSLEIEVEDDFTPQDLNQKPVEHKTKPKSELVNDFLSPVEALNLDQDQGQVEEKAKTVAPKTTRTKTAKKSDQPKKPHKVRRIILIVILVILLLLGGFLTWGILWGNDIIAKITGGQGTVWDLLAFTEEKYEPLKTDANGRTNILAFGTSGYNMDGDEGNGTHAGAQLTDSIMMISLNQETGDIAMLSLPRDLKASPTCTSTGKINEVYWCNGGGGDATTEEEAKAASALMAEVGSILGVDFQYYAHLNWGSLVQIVDTLGGITITLDEDIHDYYWTGAVFEAGQEYTINGEQALGLARARHGTLGGDFSRGTSQQKILIGIKNKIFEKDLSITDLLSLASTLGDNLRTNFSLQDIKSLAIFSSEYDLENMRQISLYDPINRIYYMTTGTINGISYVLPAAGVGNYGAIQSYVTTNLSNDPRVYENASIIVLNATETTGLAALVRDALVEEGYQNIAVDNAPAGTYDAQYNIYVLNDKVQGTAKLLESHFNTDTKSATDLPDGITRDYDIVIILGPSSTDS